VSKRSYLLSAGPLVNDVKEAIGSIVTLIDITERKRAEEQQNVLVAELNHRVKNILAIVQSVASQTARRSSSLGAFTSTFSGRVKALAVAHDILTQTRWIGIGLNELLQAVLAPYRYPDEHRVVLSGPPILVPARMVLPLSMAVHELATNASKYGALSNSQGIVQIGWSVTDGETHQLAMSWHEHGGPAVKADESTGFGTTLIRRVVEYDLKGKADLHLLPEGMRGELSFPLKDGALSAEQVGEAINVD
jgi:two-component sensor histidine kinase